MKERIYALARSGRQASEIAREVFLGPYMEGADAERVNAIVIAVASSLNIQPNQIFVSGSAKLGFSLMHGHRFVRGDSDLDLAIVSPELTERLMRTARSASGDQLSDEAFQPHFMPGLRTSTQVKESFWAYAREGTVRPDLMPRCCERDELAALFDRLTEDNLDHFSEITGLFYLSLEAFLAKEASRVQRFLARVQTTASATASFAHKGISTRAVGGAPIPVLPKSGLLSDYLAAVDRHSYGIARVHLKIRDLLASLSRYVNVVAIMLTPLPGGDHEVHRDPVDVIVYYALNASADVESTVGRLWQIGARYTRNQIAVRFIPADSRIDILLGKTIEYALAMRRELGDSAVAASRLMVVDLACCEEGGQVDKDI